MRTELTTLPATKFTVTFESADASEVDRLGGKGAGLARMTQDGLRVPPGFIVTTDACREYLANDAVPDGLADEVLAQLSQLEGESGKTFGRGPLPLLLSVRSGAPVSMPGMMDTILNLGLDRDAAIALAESCGDTRFMAELVARFHAMYSEIVLSALDAEVGVSAVVKEIRPEDPAPASYDRVWRACEQALLAESGESVPSDPQTQLLGAVAAVFRSWNTRRARTYRSFHGIPHDLGTAVVVQSMVFGNMGSDSGSGVVFTRNPVSGEPGMFGEYLAASQGEDVVAGIRTPDPVGDALDPVVLAELTATCAELETSHGDVLDVEFTVERSTLYLLQVRSAKRTPEAAVRIAADLLAERKVSLATAMGKVTLDHIRQVMRPGFNAEEVAAARSTGRLLTTGIGACPGQVSGKLVLDPDRAMAVSDGGAKVILARMITSPADLHGMIAAEGIVTATGGSTSHAAVVARSLATACVVGASEMDIDEHERTLTVGSLTYKEGDLVSIDGTTGELFLGEFATSTPTEATGALSVLLETSTIAADCEIFGRVILPTDVEEAVATGATGVLAAVDDVLAAGGLHSNLVRQLIAHRHEEGAAQVRGIAELVAAAFTPFLSSAGDAEVTVRAIDTGSDELSEYLKLSGHDSSTAQPKLLATSLPWLLDAQLEGLAVALRDSGGRAKVHLVLDQLSDPAETKTLLALVHRHSPSISVGPYVENHRDGFTLEELSLHAVRPWLDLLSLTAECFGIASDDDLNDQPRDANGASAVDGAGSSTQVDPLITALRFREVVDSAQPGNAGADLDEIGVYIGGEVTLDVIAGLRGLGIKRFAVDLAEIRPLQLALGKAAVAT